MWDLEATLCSLLP